MKEFIHESSILLFGIIIGFTIFIIDPPQEFYDYTLITNAQSLLKQDSVLLEKAALELDKKDEKITDLEERLKKCENSAIYLETSQKQQEKKRLNWDEKQILNLQPIKTMPTYRGNSGHSFSDIQKQD